MKLIDGGKRAPDPDSEDVAIICFRSSCGISIHGKRGPYGLFMRDLGRLAIFFGALLAPAAAQAITCFL